MMNFQPLLISLAVLIVVFNVADSVTTELCIHHSNKNLTEGNSWGKALLDNNLFWVFQGLKQVLVLGIAAFAIKTRNKPFKQLQKVKQ